MKNMHAIFSYIFPKSSSIILLALSLTPLTALAGGLELYEMGTPGVGLAAAGEAARAQDASTLFTNPAGMTSLERSQILLGAQAMYGDAHFDRDANTTMPGDASGNPVGFFPGGSFFYVQNISPDLAVGLGSFLYFGLPLDFANEWSGRYYSQDNALLGMSLMLSIAYKLTELLSVGVGLNAMYGMMQQQATINNVDLDFKDKPSYDPLGQGISQLLSSSRELDMGMFVPTELMFSAYHEVNDCWAILGSAGWQDWSSFGKVDVAIDESRTDFTTTTDMNT
ncbi:MAG: outer membrane protein transport protein [Deltaproteobacteria bacterium]|nr:outer membrane protein transport protein [Deltaproteobacteria bacterium]